MHAEDIPAILESAAKHHAPACGVNGWRFNQIIIQTPHHVTYRSMVAHRHGKVDVRFHAKIPLSKMIRGLVPPAQFAARRTQQEIWIETGGQLVGVSGVESF